MIVFNLFSLVLVFYLFKNQADQASAPDFIRGAICGVMVFSINFFLDWRFRKKFHPIWGFFIGNIILLGMGGRYIARVLGTEAEQNLSISGHLPLHELYDGFLLLFSSALFFLIGFYLNQKPSKFLILTRESKNYIFPKDALIWLITFGSWGCKFARFLPGVLGTTVGLLPLGVLYVFGLKYYTTIGLRKRVYVLYVLIIIIVELAFASRSAMREGYVTVFIPLLLATGWASAQGPSVLAQKKPGYGKKKRFAAVAALIFVFWFLMAVIFPAANAVKSRQVHDFKTAFVMIVTKKQTSDDPGALKKNMTNETLEMRRAIIITSAAICIRLSKMNLRMEHDPLQLFAAGFIPRALWPNKPVIEKGGWFNKFLLRLLGLSETEGDTSMALSAAGELFWAYGVAGVMIIMLLTGLLFSFFHNIGYTNDLRNIFNSTLLIALASFYLKAFDGNWSATVSLLSLIAALSIFTSKFLVRNRQRP